MSSVSIYIFPCELFCRLAAWSSVAAVSDPWRRSDEARAEPGAPADGLLAEGLLADGLLADGAEPRASAAEYEALDCRSNDGWLASGRRPKPPRLELLNVGPRPRLPKTELFLWPRLRIPALDGGQDGIAPKGSGGDVEFDQMLALMGDVAEWEKAYIALAVSGSVRRGEAAGNPEINDGDGPGARPPGCDGMRESDESDEDREEEDDEEEDEDDDDECALSGGGGMPAVAVLALVAGVDPAAPLRPDGIGIGAGRTIVLFELADNEADDDAVDRVVWRDALASVAAVAAAFAAALIAALVSLGGDAASRAAIAAATVALATCTSASGLGTWTCAALSAPSSSFSCARRRWLSRA
jgi:hypothetical protein